MLQWTSQRDVLQGKLGVRTTGSADKQLAAVDLVVWAVKPQVFREALQRVGEHIRNALNISIAAGLPLKTLSDWLNTERVVRAMPNTAALVGAGVTGIAAAAGVSAEDRARAGEVLAGTGYCFWVENDERLDAVTAVSGSGPAYVFHFLDAFQAAAERLGFDAKTARDLALRTTAGAVEQARLGDPFATLRSRVTSKRGTTEAALAILDARNHRESLIDAVNAAYVRAGELSKELADS